MSIKQRCNQLLENAAWHLTTTGPAIRFEHPTPDDREAIRILLNLKEK